MSNITTQQPIRYQIDTLNPKTYGVITSNSNSILDFSRVTSITAINVLGSQPPNTARYIAFNINGQWGKLSSAGAFVSFSDNSPDFENLELYANTPTELAAISSASGLAGTSCGVAIALSSTDPDNAIPTCGLSFTCLTDTQQLTTIELSPEYSLGSNSQIISFTADTSTADGGAVDLSAKITRQDGTASDWITLPDLVGEKATTIQFKADLSARTLGVSTAKVNSTAIVYSDNNTIISGANKGEVISLTEDWYMPVKSCRLTVKHSPLENSSLAAFIAFRASPVQVSKEYIGIGSGGRKVFQLANTSGLKYDTLKLYYDNVRVYSDFEFNCQAGRITCSAPEGVIVSCDYEYGWTDEIWQEMSAASTLSFEDYDQTEYRFTGNQEGLSVCALKLEISMSTGHIDNELLGKATGGTQSFRLNKRINDGRIYVFVETAPLSNKNWTLLDDPQYIAVSAAAGKNIYASYDWISEPVNIYEYYAVYSE